MAPRQTAFYDRHQRLGGKIVDFAGYAMPVQYTGIVEEHRRVRSSVGVFDVSHMGEVEIRGRDALSYLQKITINDVSRLFEGRVQYSAMCMEHGGIVDDLLVYHLGDRYMMVINASNIDKDLAWMRSHRVGDVEIVDRSAETSLLAIQGPKSLATLQKLTPVDLSSLAYYHFVRGTVAGVEMIISRTGYTGELGFEIYFTAPASTACSVWDAVMDAGKEYGIGPTGLGARDTLRLEMGFCLYGHDIDETTNPIEAGLGWITKVEKGEFIGRAPIQACKSAGPQRRLVGFTLEDRAFPRQHYAIRAGAQDVGRVTSGTFSPILDRGIGMGYVPSDLSKPGTAIGIVIRDREVPATVVPLPFIKK